jgi:hypothetical protein
MKSTPSPNRHAEEAEMPAEYKLDWSKARPNAYAARLKDCFAAVVLAPQIAVRSAAKPVTRLSRKPSKNRSE